MSDTLQTDQVGGLAAAQLAMVQLTELPVAPFVPPPLPQALGPNGQMCGTCFFHDKAGNNACRRMPPTVLLIHVNPENVEDIKWAGVWTITRPTDWCGEWKPR